MTKAEVTNSDNIHKLPRQEAMKWILEAYNQHWSDEINPYTGSRTLKKDRDGGKELAFEYRSYWVKGNWVCIPANLRKRMVKFNLLQTDRKIV